MARDLRQVRIEVVRPRALEQVTDLLMELEAPRRRKVVVERLPHQLVGERVPAGRRRELGDDADGARLTEHAEEPGRAQPARPLEQVQVELAPYHRRDPEECHGLARQSRDAAADQRAHLLGNAHERVLRARPEALGGEQPDDLLDEEGIAAGDLVQPFDERRVGR